MTDRPAAKHSVDTPTEQQSDPWLRDPRAKAWMDEHATELRRTVSDQRILWTSLAIAFVIGLAAQIGGYAIRSTAPKEPLALAADLLYALGWSLWTGAVVVVLVQVVPEMKRRQIQRALDSYDAVKRDRS